MNDDEALVTVYVSTDVGRLEIIHSALAGEGIDSVLDNQRQAGLTGVLESRLLVRAEDESAALEFIALHEQAGNESED